MTRGVIEGFYGTPWSHAERLDLIRFCADEGFDTWVHAPKDDPYHRAKWDEPYPDEELARLAELVAEASRAGVDFVYAIAPGLSIRYTFDEDFERLLAKCDQVRAVGVARFHLLWDDLEHTLNCREDDERYGHEEPPSAAAQSELSNRFAVAVEQSGPLVICPMGYAGTGDSPYRRVMRRLLDPGIVVYWTGPEVVSLAITREELDTAAARFGDHDLLIWDNYPVNDFEPDRLFLAPLRARDPRLWGGRVSGLVANGMLQAVPGKLPLATVGEYLRDPAGYDPVRAFERALTRYGAEVVDALRTLAAGEPVSDTFKVSDTVEIVDSAALVDALALGVDAATALALLEPHV